MGQDKIQRGTIKKKEEIREGSENMGTEAVYLSKKELLNLGEQYLKIRNYDSALNYLSRAVLQGSGRAGAKLYELGKIFYKERKYEPALQCFQTLAGQGHGDSALFLGQMYEKGYGVSVSLQKAFDSYASAYQMGVPQGAYQAGRLMTADALRSEEVRDIAISWYKEAIAGGVYKGYAEIGKLYQNRGRNERPGDPPKDDRIALSWFLRGAVHGDNLSRELAGEAFLNGKGTEINVKRGLELYSQAFHDGSVSVCFKLGDLYFQGGSVHKNIDLAVAWYLKAYERGDKRGKYEAGRVSYLAGRNYPGIPEGTEEKEKALHYLKQAASFGFADAFEELADISISRGDYKEFEDNLKQGYKAGSDTCRKKLVRFYCSKAMKFYGNIKRVRSSMGMECLGTTKEDIRNLKEAADWYKKAAAAGDSDAWAMLARMYLFYGDRLECSDRDFLRAAREGRHSLNVNMNVLLWMYFAGPEPLAGQVLHKENPKKAFKLAQLLAKQGFTDFYGILSSYYENGYGTKISRRMADYWAEKA